MRLRQTFLVATFCLSGFALVFAQSVPPPPAPPLPVPSPQSTVRVTTRIVQVSVTVRDELGRPVKGLTKDDFVLLDDGQRQQIASISEQSNRLTTTSAAAPNSFTNRFAQGAAQPTLTVIVLDAYNTRYLDYRMPCPPPVPYTACFHTVDAIFQAVEKFITQMQPQDRVALYELADNLYLLQDFTSDPEALQRGVDSGKDYVGDIRFPGSQTDPLTMSKYTMDAMHTIATRLAKVPGRKNLIWLSTGFPPDDGLGAHPSKPLGMNSALNTNEKIDSTAKILGNADLPLSAISAWGLVPLLDPGPVPHGGGGVPAGRASGANLPTPARADGNYGGAATSGKLPDLNDFDFTKSLADLSGGRAFYNTNDFAGAIRSAIDDSAATYILGYYPDHNKWNGEFRSIKVKVNRPGVEVHARKGYFAVGETATAIQMDAQKLADAVRSPLESTDLGFDVQADGVDVSGARQLKVKITLDAGQLRFQQQGVRWTDNITEAWLEVDAQGRQVGHNLKTINLNTAQQEHDRLLRDGLSFLETIPVEKNAAEVRLVLRDVGNGAIGSVIIPLEKLFAANSARTPEK
jgi:VWFA-related protein